MTTQTDPLDIDTAEGQIAAMELMRYEFRPERDGWEVLVPTGEIAREPALAILGAHEVVSVWGATLPEAIKTAWFQFVLNGTVVK